MTRVVRCSSRRDAALAVNRNRRMEPVSEPHVGDALPHPPDEILAGRDARRDDLVRERLGDDLVGDLHHMAISIGLFRQLPLEPADREHLGRPHARRVLRAERLQQLIPFVGGQPVGVVPGLRRVDADDLGIALLDEFPQAVPLLVVGGGHDLEEPVIVEAPHRQAIDGAAPLAEHQDGAASRRVRGQRRHRTKHGVVVVLARHDDPHVDLLALHQRREHGIESLLNPRLDERRLLAVRQHPIARIGRGLSEDRGRRDDGSEQKQGETRSGHGQCVQRSPGLRRTVEPQARAMGLYNSHTRCHA